MRRKRGRLGEIVLALAILAVVGAIGWRLIRFKEVREIAAEGGMDYNRPSLDRIQVTVPGRPHFIPDLVNRPDTIRRWVTFTLSTNSHGFRGPEYTLEKPAGSFRIACVGECVTYGNGVVTALQAREERGVAEAARAVGTGDERGQWGEPG